MISEGLVGELEDFHARFTKRHLDAGVVPDYTRGVYQSIGLRTFHDYLVMDEEGKETAEGRAVFAKAAEEMKLVTRRYAR
jgi:tRNA dimethylallyltransferase